MRVNTTASDFITAIWAEELLRTASNPAVMASVLEQQYLATLTPRERLLYRATARPRLRRHLQRGGRG